jgi:hypothetical protein
MQDQGGWYIARDDQQVGPLTAAEMREFIRCGHLNSADHVWRLGFDNWQRAGDVPGLLQPPPRMPRGRGERIVTES